MEQSHESVSSIRTNAGFIKHENLTVATEVYGNQINPILFRIGTSNLGYTRLLRVLCLKFIWTHGKDFRIAWVSTTPDDSFSRFSSAAVQVAIICELDREVNGRDPVFWDHLLLVGPRDNPARLIAGCTVGDALEKLSGNKAQFCTTSYDPAISDMEMRLWKAAGTDLASTSWYSTDNLPEAQALQNPSEKGAYVFTSRSTYLTLKQNGAIPNMTVYVEGENSLVMPYTVLVNPDKIDNSAHRLANRFAEWLSEETAQRLFGGYGRVWEQGVPLYTPADRKEVATEDMLIDKDL